MLRIKKLELGKTLYPNVVSIYKEVTLCYFEDVDANDVFDLLITCCNFVLHYERDANNCVCVTIPNEYIIEFSIE